MPTRASSLPIMLEPCVPGTTASRPAASAASISARLRASASTGLASILAKPSSTALMVWSQVLSSAKVTLQMLTPASRQRVA